MPCSLRSSHSSANLVELQLQRSRLLFVVVVTIHFVAALPALLLPLPLFARICWLACIGAALAWKLLQQPITSVRLLSDGRWRLSVAHRTIDADLCSWYAHPWCCVALFHQGWRFRRAVVVPSWTVSSDAHRRLRVALRASAVA